MKKKIINNKYKTHRKKLLKLKKISFEKQNASAPNIFFKHKVFEVFVTKNVSPHSILPCSKRVLQIRKYYIDLVHLNF